MTHRTPRPDHIDVSAYASKGGVSLFMRTFEGSWRLLARTTNSEGFAGHDNVLSVLYFGAEIRCCILHAMLCEHVSISCFTSCRR